MANQDHVDRRREGVASWKRWREHHLEVRPDLTGADLSQADLSYAEVRGCILNWANLSREMIKPVEQEMVPHFSSLRLHRFLLH